ncbi:hypothetical protein ISU02_04945 [Fusibacter sp. Q10-2]|uniref:Uncharacterized protein n=1 Tax=Fusibacter ferrireducens TaxID=2785058 RepID=A0ABR9ZPR0_9FIRM|nr:hypothetical protein [Fusibacter ferrireducens]
MLAELLVIFEASDLTAQIHIAQTSYEIAVANLDKAKARAISMTQLE